MPTDRRVKNASLSPLSLSPLLLLFLSYVLIALNSPFVCALPLHPLSLPSSLPPLFSASRLSRHNVDKALLLLSHYACRCRMYSCQINARTCAVTSLLSWVSWQSYLFPSMLSICLSVYLRVNSSHPSLRHRFEHTLICHSPIDVTVTFQDLVVSVVSRE